MSSLRIAARIALAAGAVGSIGLMLHVGHRQKSIVLIAMFLVWVLSPFIGLVMADVRSKRWPARARAIVHWAAIFVALACIAAYADVVLRPPAKPASRFLLVPLASWVVIGVVFLAARRRAGTDTAR
jgi:hypothetical protein